MADHRANPRLTTSGFTQRLMEIGSQMSNNNNRRETESVTGSRRQFLSIAAMTAAAAVVLRPRAGWAADVTDSRVADIVATTIGIDTHNHVDVPLTEAEMPGPDIDLVGENEAVGPLGHLYELCDGLPAGCGRV
jgi:hypothetical protein